MIAAAHKSSGKTVVSTGLAAALHARKKSVQTFKKGPDYIDPMWLRAASRRACYNLDYNTMNDREIRDLFVRKSGGSLALIEANKGLFDGVDPSGTDSNAAMAKLLRAPVILVVDTTGTTRGIAPLLLGYRAFDKDVNIAGVILNKTGGARHEGKLRAAVETYTDIPVVGAIGKTRELDIGERHLGLTTPAETGELSAMIGNFGRIVGGAVDLDRLTDIAATAPQLPKAEPAATAATGRRLRIGLARDTAFGFYYDDDLEAFAANGADLIDIDLIHDTTLPALDGLFIGGGFPETQAGALAANAVMRANVKAAIENGLPTYAECGGLMYLCDNLVWHGQSHAMVGVISGDAVMCSRPQGRGYARYATQATHPWDAESTDTAAHEFHYARIDGLSDDVTFARKILRGHGTDGQEDGVVAHNLVAGFCHLRHSEANPWVSKFVDFARSKTNSGGS